MRWRKNHHFGWDIPSNSVVDAPNSGSTSKALRPPHQSRPCLVAGQSTILYFSKYPVSTSEVLKVDPSLISNWRQTSTCLHPDSWFLESLFWEPETAPLGRTLGIIRPKSGLRRRAGKVPIARIIASTLFKALASLSRNTLTLESHLHLLLLRV